MNFSSCFSISSPHTPSWENQYHYIPCINVIQLKFESLFVDWFSLQFSHSLFEYPLRTKIYSEILANLVWESFNINLLKCLGQPADFGSVLHSETFSPYHLCTQRKRSWHTDQKSQMKMINIWNCIMYTKRKWGVLLEESKSKLVFLYLDE
jgi:hypothetical protein